ncbi:malate dehydrogenase [Candidatus Synchoanobacter obligatus]|uniref:Malate dehydrogenase n=1 Tax=Candidatus Synchoanobacter obligatus TaxID=2919597 RepID=A0ABT1L928_9GAMM|nr:malate dehydrogenase [Candidatus Synchoanobacter obligatus]MCP8352603.1 malate dehydrogenase [Candidatus Synchoanobacter obligatus]
MNEITVAITGAAGQIAYQLIPMVLGGHVFGDAKIHLKLVDIPVAVPKLAGVVMEMEDCAWSHMLSVEAFSSDALDQGFKDIDFAFLVGASPRTKGMERADLLSKNGNIFKVQGQALSDYAKPSVEVLVVGNPCNTNCLIAMKHARNIPDTQFYAMTMLDEHRARYQISRRLNVAIDAVKEVFIYGNHSATQFPDYENAKPAVDHSDPWWQETFVPMIQTRGAAVIQARGASSAASAAYAAAQTAQFIVQKSDQPFSVARLSMGDYGSPEDLIVSVPSYFKDGICTAYGKYTHSESASALIQASYDELQAEYDQVLELGLIDVD